MNKVDFEQIADEIKTMKKSVKNTPKENYRIVKVNNKAAETQVDYKPETISYFYAVDDDKAFAYLKSQLTNLPVKSADESYYWMNANMVIGSDGKYYDDLLSDMEDWRRRRSLWKKLTMWLHVNIIMPLIDFWNRLKDIFYWLKTGHNRHESWEIFSSMMGILKFNLPLLIKNHVGVSLDMPVLKPLGKLPLKPISKIASKLGAENYISLANQFLQTIEKEK